MELENYSNIFSDAEEQVTLCFREFLKTTLQDTIAKYRQKQYPVYKIGEIIQELGVLDHNPIEDTYANETMEIREALVKIDTLDYSRLVQLVSCQEFYLDPLNTLRQLSERNYPRN